MSNDENLEMSKILRMPHIEKCRAQTFDGLQHYQEIVSQTYGAQIQNKHIKTCRMNTVPSKTVNICMRTKEITDVTLMSRAVRE